MRAVVFGVVAAAFPAAAAAQEPVTLDEAVHAALARDLRMRLAEADVAVARANVLTARAWPNPTANLTYSKAPPRHHVIFDVPVEYPWQRSARIRAAEAGLQAARVRLTVQREEIRFEVDSVYAVAAAAQELARLSARDARDGEELVQITRRRRDAGDASTLDVELAIVSQGTVANQALTDSVAAVRAIRELQDLMGLSTSRIVITLVDSLAALALRPVPAAPPLQAAGQVPLRVAALQADIGTQQATISRERAGLFAAPTLTGGVEWGDPTTGNRKLPTVGISLPLPIFDRNRGSVAAARAALARAETARKIARDEAAEAAAAAERDMAVARIRVEHARQLREHAERVVQMSTRGYREGAFPLATVLEARRTARDALRQYVQGLATLVSARTAAALARTLGAPP